MSRSSRSNYQKFISTQEEKQVSYNNYNNYDLANYNIGQHNGKKENYEGDFVAPLCVKKNYLGLTYQGVT